MYAVACLNTVDIKDLAEITNIPKIEYCNRHGYKFFHGSEDDMIFRTEKYTSYMNFNKMHYMLELFKQHPELEWILFCECDATITNLTVKIEDKIDNDYHCIIAVDRLNLNAGNFLIRHSPEGRAYFEMICSKAEEYRDVEWAEQQVIIDTIDQYQDIVKIVPQNYMNSYEPEIYDYCDVRVDLLGNRGYWQQGDWILHWPGIRHDVRKHRAQRLLDENLIVR